RFLRNERYVDADPTASLESPKLPRPLPVVFSLEDIDRLLAMPDRKTGRGLRDAAMIETMYSTGLRVSELVTLRIDDVDLGSGCLRATGKGRKQRLVPLGDAAVDAITQYLSGSRPALLRGRSATALFLSRLGRPMTRQGFWKLLGAHARAAG